MAARAVIHLPARVTAGQPFEVRATVAHAMETGYRNDDGGNRLPRDLVRRFECRLEGELVFSAELFAAVSANPYLSFWMQTSKSGELSFVWQGDQGFEHREVRVLAVG
ncbi:thiosulfate oxidation carrier complex protein SoxZ [Roseateles puraquae]|uniref:Thiosulfate oxidation carrier complex protein SoxZ n=1 Tax=Roseateles puraquae TaxID=431059 RepID=A0A254NC34_9BURK|nr:thiosulfate oxidation carrier complex protein SoxZ [Roseateles puraquae]MDG0854195.1 thiosulfate oxidation carrier complex protein SoxZ [Roseateles puraquae]OWR05516.1 thiosulfate oxidation carrier complex protein SoxZ [Roseateles puraquae]